ncbi:MAG: DUF2505 domain-containing protein [Actinomycetota bacterium]|nr:DUF2505 domain-containing protein [Actinomycetota bacterium]
MTKQLVHDLTYDAPAGAVTAMLADPAFREEVCDYLGVLRKTVVIEPAGEGMHVTIDQWQRTSGMPSFAKRLVGDETNIVQREIWSTPRLGDITVSIPGKPGSMTGTARIDEAHGVTTETVDMAIHVGIPLVGSKLEGLLSDLLRKALEAENMVGRDYLSR